MKIRTVLVDLKPDIDLVVRDYVGTLFREFDGDCVVLSEVVINDGLLENDFSVLVDVQFDDYFNVGAVVKEIMDTSFFSIFADENNVIRLSDLIEYGLVITKNNNIAINSRIMKPFKKSVNTFVNSLIKSLRFSNE